MIYLSSTQIRLNISRITGINWILVLGTAVKSITTRIDTGSPDETKMIFSLSAVIAGRDISVTDAFITSPEKKNYSESG